MNAADSQRVASELEHLGYEHTRKTGEADVIVLNTCMVRQSARRQGVWAADFAETAEESAP